jgi:hypothetical protein
MTWELTKDGTTGVLKKDSVTGHLRKGDVPVACPWPVAHLDTLYRGTWTGSATRSGTAWFDGSGGTDIGSPNTVDHQGSCIWNSQGAGGLDATFSISLDGGNYWRVDMVADLYTAFIARKFTGATPIGVYTTWILNTADFSPNTLGSIEVIAF